MRPGRCDVMLRGPWMKPRCRLRLPVLARRGVGVMGPMVLEPVQLRGHWPRREMDDVVANFQPRSINAVGAVPPTCSGGAKTSELSSKTPFGRLF